jgi:hypothetical protein
MVMKRNWFSTLNEALESESLVDRWPLGLNINYGETQTAVSNGLFISVYRSEKGLYERPVFYKTKMEPTHYD